jgi:hypothetical protein
MTAHGNEPIQEPKRVVILIRPDKPILYLVPPRAQLKPFRMCEDCFEMRQECQHDGERLNGLEKLGRERPRSFVMTADHDQPPS